MTEKSFTVNLKVKYENDGSFINARLLKGKSSIGEDLLGKINDALKLLQSSPNKENIDVRAINSVDIKNTISFNVEESKETIKGTAWTNR